ncbi:MAG: hypothetical protein AB1428_13070 [Bacteroidota bacterium]
MEKQIGPPNPPPKPAPRPKAKLPVEPGEKGGSVKITMKNSGSFTGAVTKAKYVYSSYAVLEVFPEDIAHIDKTDYWPGIVDKPTQESKKK